MSFSLRPGEPFSERYFVPHSGVSRALEVLQLAISNLLDGNESFCPYLIKGPKGSGKSHLAHIIFKLATDSGLSVKMFDEILDAGSFVADYEELKNHGGLFLVSFDTASSEITKNPHVSSRLNTLRQLEITFPTEAELRPIIESLAERRNLKLPAKSLEFLLKRLPLQPLSFDNIFAKVDELALSTGKPIKQSVVKEALSES